MNMGRFYQRDLPEVEELVMARIESIDDTGISCRLLEYDDAEAFLPYLEVSKKRIRSIRQVLTEGKVKVLQVLRVDLLKGYIDLSKKHLTLDQIKEGEDKYEKGKHVASMMQHLADTLNLKYEEVCEQIAWPLYEGESHPYQSLKEWAWNGLNIFEEINVSSDVQAELQKIVQQRTVRKEQKVDAIIEVMCYSADGIDDIKKTLKSVMTDYPNVNIRYVAAPEYQLSTLGSDPDVCKQLLMKVAREINRRIGLVGGESKMKIPLYENGIERSASDSVDSDTH